MMKQHSIHEDIVGHIREQDLYSKWMGVEVLEIREGFCRLKMMIRREMMNGIGTVHGGILFSLADTAFGYASNNRNNLSVSLDVSIAFLKSVHAGDVITAEAKEIHNGRSTGVYLISVQNQHDEQVALVKGTCFRTGKPLLGESTSL